MVVVVALLVLGGVINAAGGNGKKHGKHSTNTQTLGGGTGTTVTLAFGTNSTATISAKSTPVTRTAKADPSLRDAKRLAAYQEGVSSVSGSDPLVPKLAAQLRRLQPYCREDEDHLAGEIWGTWQDLQRNGVHESMLSVFKHVRGSIPRSIAPTHCDQIMAAYLVLRER